MPVTRTEQSSEAAGGWELTGELGFEGPEAHKAWAGWGPVCGGIYFGMGVLVPASTTCSPLGLSGYILAPYPSAPSWGLRG